jgi:hypothetical protein
MRSEAINHQRGQQPLAAPRHGDLRRQDGGGPHHPERIEDRSFEIALSPRARGISAAHEVRRAIADAFEDDHGQERQPFGRLVSTFVREGLEALQRLLGIGAEPAAESEETAATQDAGADSGDGSALTDERVDVAA